jgi:CRISPR-associated protein Csy3
MAKTDKPALLSYQRSLSPTDGVFRTVVNGREVPVEVTQKTTLGTQSQFFSVKTDVPAYGNPQRVEAAALPIGSGVLLIDWRMTAIAAALEPQSCDVPQWRHKLAAFVKAYAAAGGFDELGRRYAANIANGRWAYKNRLFASGFKVEVSARTFPLDHKAGPSEQRLEFDALAHSLNDVADAGDAQVGTLGQLIAEALSGASKMVRLEIRGILEVGDGAVVYPSQEFAEKENGKGGVGKVLYGVFVDGVERCAAFHEQKIGAAIRTIDTWHGGMSEDGVIHVDAAKPLPVNPYAQDRDAHVVVRRRQLKTDFYTLLDKDLDKMVETAKGGEVTDAMHFTVANLVRGGVFGMKEAKEAAQP